MALSVITPPTTFPVTLAEAKAQVRHISDDENALIQSLVEEATAHVEKQLEVALSTRMYRLTLDTFSEAIRLPHGHGHYTRAGGGLYDPIAAGSI